MRPLLWLVWVAQGIKDRWVGHRRLCQGRCPQCGSPKVTLTADDTLTGIEPLPEAASRPQTCPVCFGWAGRSPPPRAEWIGWLTRWKRQGRRRRKG